MYILTAAVKRKYILIRGVKTYPNHKSMLNKNLNARRGEYILEAQVLPTDNREKNNYRINAGILEKSQPNI